MRPDLHLTSDELVTFCTRVRDLKAKNVPTSEIARRLGCSTSSLHQRLRREATLLGATRR